ncbi:MAG TPA: BON domain-containing protein [Thermoanaerobaculia bacterium]|nr:BON domain-containing protein [Thermoanaerobaculia bacterium]
MAYRDRDRDEEFRRGREEEFGIRGPYGERYGRGFEEGGRGRESWGPQGGRQEWRSGFRYGPSRYGQHGGYSQEGRYDPQRIQGPLPESGMGGGYSSSVGWAGEGYRRYGESYGRGPEGFDRETGSFAGYRGPSGAGRTPGVGGDWERFVGRAYGAGYGRGTEEAGGYGYSEPSRFGETYGAPTRTRGRFTGRGPKGYSRSDARIREEVSDRLEQHGEIDASEIEVRVESGEVTLEGTVSDRLTKRLAEDVVEDCPGVKQVHNRIRVQGEMGQSTIGDTTGSRAASTTTGRSTTKPVTRT